VIERAFAGNLSQEEPQIGRLIVVNTKSQLQQGATKVSQGAAIAAASLGSAAQSAAQEVAQRAQSAAASANAGLRAGTYSARGWVGPRLEEAADYTTSTAAPAVSAALTKQVAPRVSSALRTTARQVTPEDILRKRSLRSALAWTALSATVLAAAGAVATLVWRRYREAMAADTEPDTMVPGAGDGDGETSDAKTSDGTPQAGTTPAGDETDGSEPRPATSTW
jgi:hypothetical protein